MSFHKHLNISLWNVVYGLTHPPNTHTLWLCLQLPNNCLLLGCDPLKTPKPRRANPWSWSKVVLNLWRHRQGESNRCVQAAADSSARFLRPNVLHVLKELSSPLFPAQTGPTVISSAVVTRLCDWRLSLCRAGAVFKYKAKPKVKNNRGYLW